MLRITLWLAAAMLFLLASGCASISKDECLQGDWYSLGVNDGKAGELPAKFHQYKKDCGAHGVTPDFAKYEQGHRQGLVFFCDFLHGEAWGRSGKAYNTACTGTLEPSFRAGFQQGQRWYQAKSAVDEVAFAIADLQNQNALIRDDIYRLNEQIALEQNPQRRAALLRRTDELRYQLELHNQQIGRLQIRLADAEARFAPLNR